MSDVALASIQRRVRGMHHLWHECLDTMDAEQVNAFERPGVLPIAFSVHHMVRIEDQVCSMIFNGRQTLWDRGGWGEKTQVSIDESGKELTVAEMEEQRIGDYEAYKSYAYEVFDETDEWLAGFDAAALSDVMFGGIIPPVFQHAYVARVVGDGPILKIDGIECWIFQHGIRHLGETEHGRALVGLGGLTS